MKKNVGRKIISLLIVMAFFGLTLVPVMNAQQTADELTYDLLIITPSKFTRALQSLVEHKNRVGVQTTMFTLGQIYREMVEGRDKPEKIKYFIKDAVEDWGIKYVMLVGNFRSMPVRYCYNDEPWEVYPEPNFISELYYADIYDQYGEFSSWDTNDNGIFGEWEGESAQDYDIDLYPDVFVGRLACRNRLEVRIMVNKIITYETTTYGKEWFNRIVAIAGDTYPDGQYPFPTPEYEGEENALIAIEYMPDFEPTTLFTSDETLSGPDDVINAITQGCGFLFFDGHANPGSWSTHKPNSKEWVNGLSLQDMGRLRNGDKLPVCIVGGCHNLQFDVALTNFLKGFKEA